MAVSVPPAMMSQFVLPDDQPVVRLDAGTAFEALAPNEKLYSHYLSRASWYGGLIVLYQTSPESPDIFRLIHSVNRAESTEQLKEKALAAGLTEAEFNAYLIYCAGFYANMGNYKGFGDSKFVPALPVEKLESFILATEAAKNPAIVSLLQQVKVALYSLSDREKQLGLGEKGVTKYFSPNCDTADSDLVNKYLKAKNIEGYINRLIKSVENGVTVYEVRHAAVQNSVLLEEEEFEGCRFRVTAGDYQELLQKVCENLELAVKYSSNELERRMLEEYIASFQTGKLDHHKDGSRHWIKNKGPIVETYIGFIETYRDPAGMRGEFEGFVAMVNKKMSERFQILVDRAEELLTQLPWPKDFEKDTFLRPDFTSLDVLTFGGSGVPAGINIPNYDEIRQSEGFKNVSLGNVLSSSLTSTKDNPFVSEEDNQILKKYKVPSFEVQVGLHELLGHGSGKLFIKDESGKINHSESVMNPLTGQPVDSWYGPGESYDSKFTTISSSYEECRAECAGLHLCLVPGVTEIFGHAGGEESELIKYANWLSMVHAGVKGLEMFSPATMEWKQAHSQARYVIMQVMLEAGEDFLKVEKVEGKDGKPDLLITMDRSKVETVGAKAIAAFLQKLQVYKSLGDDKSARAMYEQYSLVGGEGSHPWLAWREIVIARKQPRMILVQGNTRLSDEKMELIQYEPSPAGMVHSWVERFPDWEDLDKLLAQLSERDRQHWN